MVQCQKYKCGKPDNRCRGWKGNFFERDWRKREINWSFSLGKRRIFGYPSLPRSIGIMQLAKNLKVIYGAQQLRGKILSHKDLDPIG